MGRALTILHTNDFHNILKPHAVETITALRRRAEPDVLLLDAGDAISAGNVGVRIGGEPILTTMSEMGYAAMAMGNREFHIADSVLRHKIGNASFPVLCANMRFRDGRGRALPTSPSAMVATAGGIRVGIFGLTVPMVTERMAARIVSAFVFDDPIESARAQIAGLRPQVDILILLSHAGYKTDRMIASECIDLDLVVGGHSHVVLDHPDTSAGVPVAQAGSHGRFVGRVVLEETGDRWALRTAEVISLNAAP
jgi:2',3'-cyclic-nucleotide 2'-phosphodiesterase (5'-nucleotidase family)